MHEDFATIRVTGRAREWNGDHVGVDSGLGVLVVADGGGRSSIEADAARVAVEAILSHLRTHGTPSVIAGVRHQALRLAVEAAHEALVTVGRGVSEAGALTSTVVVCQVQEGHATFAHVGNTRAYLLGPRGLCQVTQDHTWIGERMAHGLVTPQEARAHPFRGAITQFLGGETMPEVEVQEREVSASERILLCTDGFWEGLSDFQLWTLGTQPGPLREALDALLIRSMTQCGEDDASGVLWQGTPRSWDRWKENAQPSSDAKRARSMRAHSFGSRPWWSGNHPEVLD